jgi:hypothetical protein
MTLSMPSPEVSVPVGPNRRASEPTLASTWYAVADGPISDLLLEWPPDVFALTNVLLARAEAFRFALPAVREGLLGPPRG